MKVEELPISESVKEVIVKSGITELYPPQEEAIRAGALEGRNLILASPTASGKTLIAELCALKHIQEKEGKVLYLTPLRALASEKYQEFKKYAAIKKRDGRRVSVGISTGDFDSSDPWLERYDLIITSVDYEEPTVIRENRVTKIVKIGEFIDDLMRTASDKVQIESETEVLDVSNLNLETIAFDPEDFKLTFRKVSKVVRHKVDAPLYRLKLETGRGVTVTGSHSVYTLDGLNVIAKKVSKIRAGNLVLTPRRFPLSPSEDPEINLTRELSGLRKAENLFVKKIPKRFFESSAFEDLRAKAYDKKNWKKRRELPLAKVIALGLDRELSASHTFFSYTASRHKVPIKIPVNKELLRLIGYYIAEGSMDEDNYRISFSLNSEEIEYIKDIQQCTERLFHFKPCVDKKKNVTYVDICDKVAYLLFSGVLNLPRGAKKKRVPQIVFNVKQELQREFLKSLIGGDGIFGPRVDYVTSSRLLASDLLYLLLQNGVIGGLSHGRKKVKLPSGRSTRASRFDVYVSAWSELSSINLYPELREPSRHQRSHRVCMIPTDHIRGILGALSRGSSYGSFVHFGRRTNKEKFEEWLDSREKRAKLETLELLREHGSLTSSQVSETLEIPWSTANTRLKSLLRHRLVKRWGRTGHYTYHISSRGFRLLEKIKLARKLFNSHLSFARVREIKRVNPTGNYVYDISVPGCENFVAGLGGVICHNTNEKCDSLLRHRTRWMDEISLIVADEVHLLNDAERGPTLEVVLARLMQVNPDAQLLALSATVKNAEEAAEWLKAGFVTTEWRPVVLKEGVLLQKEIQFKDGGALKIEKRSKNPAINLALHIIRSGGQALIFASTRKNSVTLAKKAAAEVTTLLSKPMKRSLTRVAEEVLTTGERTRISELLAELIRHGSAFHHAGLGGAHRRFIEDAFREGKIKVLTATPTLAFGVNLPARMVVIDDYRRYEPGYGYYPITVLEYKQMAGRAGRPRYDKIGEALLISKTEDERDYLMESYVLAEPERIWSKLAVERILRSHVLATIAADFAHTEQGIYDFFGKTFYAYQYDPKAIKGVITKILKFLYDEKMIEVSGADVFATKFGRRVSELYIDPVSGVMIRDALLNRAPRLTDISFLHMIAHTPDMFPKLRPYSREIDELALFVDEHQDEFMFDVPDEWEDRIAYEEFLGEAKLAWVLDAWIEEVSEDETIERFRVQPGDLYRLIEAARWLLYASHELATLFGHKDMLPHLAELMERTEKGVKKELLPLIRLEGIGRVRARILYNAGLKSIDDLRRAPVEKLTSLPLIGPKLAKKIKDQVGGFIKSEEWKKLKKGEAWEQRAISEYQQ